MRTAPTDAEARLWKHLRAKRLSGFKFKRQQPIGPFIVDFVSFGHRLVIEVDGSHHIERAAEDAARTEWLTQRGFRVLRFWNDEVLRDTRQVLACISLALGADHG
jgi:very-short-patch-repair endonuclease